MNDENDTEEVIEEVTEEVEGKEAEDRGDVVAEVKAEESPEEKTTAEEEKEDEPTNRMIPKSRFDEVNNRFKALQEEVATLKASQVKPEVVAEEAKNPEVSVDDLELAAANALMEGDVAKYQATQKQIRQMVVDEAKAQARADFAEQEARKSLTETARELEGKYPDLHPETGSKEKISEVIEWRDFLISQKGVPGSQALRQAVERVMGSPAPAKEPEAKDDARKGAAIEKAAATSRAQPPSLNVVGMGNRATASKVNVEDLTEEEFDALPVAEKKRMRGD